MLNITRRGPASISSLLRTTTSLSSSAARTTFTRSSILSLPARTASSPFAASRTFHISSRLRNYAAESAVETSNAATNGRKITQFEELAQYDMVHPNIVKAITEGMKITTMTEVQTETINQALEGIDIVAQARTGTGKTLGFLVPTIQNIIRKHPELAERKKYSRARASDIKAIIISPTRELAEQIAVEAEKACYHTDLIVQVAVGGNSKRAMLQKTLREGCHILVATPGRLNDLLTDEYSRVSAPSLTTLVLDEADRLLDDGFSRDVEAIIKLLPDRREVDRQTLLFSATMPKEVMYLVRDTLKPGFSFVQTVKAGDLATHDKVPQKVITTAGIENFMPCVLELAKREIAKATAAQAAGEPNTPFKAIVYLQSTANVELSYQIFENLQGDGKGGQFGKHPLAPCEIMEIHGQLTQQQRTYIADRFRRSKSAILFSTDVTARGMDFPNVTHVIQLGLPTNREQYIHRIGRTGRADKSGEGWLIIQKQEEGNARRMLDKLPINHDTTLEAAVVDMSKDAQLPATLAATLTQTGEASKQVSRSVKSSAYTSALAQNRGGNRMAQIINRWTRFGWGMEAPPELGPGMASKLGLSARDGFTIGAGRGRDNEEEGGFGGGSRGFGGGSGGGSRGGSRGFGGGGSRGFGGGDRGGSRGGFGGGDRGGDRRSGGFGDRRGGGGRSSGFGGGDRSGGGSGFGGDRGFGGGDRPNPFER